MIFDRIDPLGHLILSSKTIALGKDYSIGKNGT
jgi:hypothetical protein